MKKPEVLKRPVFEVQNSESPPYIAIDRKRFKVFVTYNSESQY